MKSIILFLLFSIFLCNGIFAASRGLRKLKPKISGEDRWSHIFTPPVCAADNDFQKTEIPGVKETFLVYYPVTDLILMHTFNKDCNNYLFTNSSPPSSNIIEAKYILYRKICI